MIEITIDFDVVKLKLVKSYENDVHNVCI